MNIYARVDDVTIITNKRAVILLIILFWRGWLENYARSHDTNKERWLVEIYYPSHIIVEYTIHHAQ